MKTNFYAMIKALQTAGANGCRSIHTPASSRHVVENMPAPGSRVYYLEEITNHPNPRKLDILEKIRAAVADNLPEYCDACVFMNDFSRVPINLPVWVEVTDEDEHTTVLRIKITRDGVYYW